MGISHLKIILFFELTSRTIKKLPMDFFAYFCGLGGKNWDYGDFYG